MRVRTGTEKMTNIYKHDGCYFGPNSCHIKIKLLDKPITLLLILYNNNISLKDISSGKRVVVIDV